MIQADTGAQGETTNATNIWSAATGIASWGLLATYCIPQQSCDSCISGWISGHHPNNAFEKVSGSACMHYGLDCCYYSYNIEIRNCSGYYVYALPPTTQQCNARYCGVNGT